MDGGTRAAHSQDGKLECDVIFLNSYKEKDGFQLCLARINGTFSMHTQENGLVCCEYDHAIYHFSKSCTHTRLAYSSGVMTTVLSIGNGCDGMLTVPLEFDGRAGPLAIVVLQRCESDDIFGVGAQHCVGLATETRL